MYGNMLNRMEEESGDRWRYLIIKLTCQTQSVTTKISM